MAWLWAASFLWAFSFGLIKGQLTGFDPVVVAAARLGLAAVAFAPLLVGGSGRPDRATALRAALLGVVQFGLMYVLYIASYRWLEAWQVALLTVFTPLYVAGLAAVRGGPRRRRHLAAAGLAVAGALLVHGATPGGLDWRGVVLLQGANLAFAVGQLGYRDLRRGGATDGTLVAWMYVGAAVVTGLVAVGRTGGAVTAGDWTPAALGSLLYLGLLPTGLGFYLWNRGAARTGAGELAAANNLKVPLAVAVSWLVFGEEAASGRVIAGLLLVCGAVAWAGATRAPAKEAP